VETYGFGQEMPVADNNTPDGRERNRRVEVWVK
jgi:outer membrane protein OmpA-like peptidoglycan-associated protein